MTRQQRILTILSESDRSAEDLATALDVSRSTILRELKVLANQGLIEPRGEGRARVYTLAAGSSDGPRPASYSTWNRAWVESYRPNVDFLLPEDLRTELRDIGSPASTLPAGTYARRILDRLLIDLSWNSSRLEGNTLTLLDTEELILRGSQPEQADARDVQMVLNHKLAIEYLVETADELEIDPITIRNLHAILSENLLADPADEGRLRRRPVQISGSKYIPLGEPQRIVEGFELVCERASAIDDPFEASFFILVHLPYLQPFIDVNKRVSRLASNIPFVRQNYYPLSFLDVDRDAYLKAVLSVYEDNDVSALATVFERGYRQSANKYAVIAQSLGEPDPFRLEYRGRIKVAVAEIVRNDLHDSDAADSLTPHLEGLSATDAATFRRVVTEELAALHEGNFARYRLRPSEFERWSSNRD